MNAADWAIVVVVLVSTVTAAFRGFFHQAFGMAGLIVGYMLAAWQYPRVAAWFAPHLNSPWLGDMLGFGAIFMGVVMVAAISRTDRSLGDERNRPEPDRPAVGCIAGISKRIAVRRDPADGHDGVYSVVAVAGRFTIGAVFPGGGQSSYMARPVGATSQVL